MIEKGEQKRPWKFGGQEESRGIDEEGEFANQSALSTEHGAGWNSEK